MAEDNISDENLENEANNVADDASTSEKVNDTIDDVADGAKEVVEDVKEEWNKVTGSQENKKVMAGILAIILGSFGVHKFILGYQKEGIILAVATVIGYATSCLGIGIFILMATGIVGLIEGIIYLMKSEEEFYETYQANQKPWF